MNREEAEILVARHFDGDLSAAEKEALQRELASDRALAELFSEQELAHRHLETLKLRWSLPADFAQRVAAGLPATSEKETLIARYFDGGLSAAEQEQLKRELAQDRELAELFNEQELAHRNLETLKLRWSLPADFTAQVLSQLPQAPEFVSQSEGTVFNWRALAVAASVLLVMGLVLGAAYINRDAGIRPDDGVAEKDDRRLPPVLVDAGPRAEVVAYSAGNVTVADTRGVTREKTVERQVALPAEVQAPADTHAVVRVGGGKAVLSPGAKARLSAKGEGVTLQPLDGDVYMEADADGVMDAQVADVAVSVKKAGVTLRRRGNQYRAEPSHGETTLRHGALTASVSDKQFAIIEEDGAFQVQEGARPQLDTWAAAGRADELKRHVATLMGVRVNDINVEKWNEVIAGLAAQPTERATHAAFMRFALRMSLLEDSATEEIHAFEKIAEILAVGTTEEDVPASLRMMLKLAEKRFEDPEQKAILKAQFKRWREECERHAREQRSR